MFVLLVYAANAGAVSSVTIAPATANGDVYTVTAADVQDAAGIDLSVYYDVSALTNPKVTAGSFASGAMMEANTSTPGFIRVVFISGAFKGTGGQLATISFTKVGKLTGRSIDLKAEITSTAGAKVAALPIVATTAPPASETEAPASTSGTTPQRPSSASASGGMSDVFNQAQQQASGGGMRDIYNQAQQQQQQQSGSNLGNVTFSGYSPVMQNPRKEEPQRDEPLRAERASDASQEAVQSTTPPAATAPASSSQAETVKGPTAKSVKEALDLLKAVEMPLQRFRAFKGARTVKVLAPLFDAGAASKKDVVQVPDIAVSDGNKIVTVKIELAVSGMVPNFSLRGANLKAIRPITDKVWELDALPQKGKSDVHLSVLLGSERVDIPLVVIPPLDPELVKQTQDLSEAGVNALLAKAEPKSGKPHYDVNSDGRQDFIDDYILVAHYLLKKQKTDNPAQKIK